MLIFDESEEDCSSADRVVVQTVTSQIRMDNSIKKFEPSLPNKSLNYCKVNDRVQTKLSKLIKKFPNGLWCCDLREKYHEAYNSQLDFKEFG